MLRSIIGRKIGMTQVFDSSGNIIPVTVIEAGPCVIIGIRTIEQDGYSAVQLAYEEIIGKNLNKPEAGLFNKHGLSQRKKIKEFRVSDVSKFSIGQEIKVDIFKKNDYVDVSGISKGKGYAGVIKRYNFGMQPVTHGQSNKTRARGSSGGQGPQKVFKGMKMSGHLGSEYVTIQRLCVVDVDIEKNILLVKGSVPAIRTGILFIRDTVKKNI
jgi:large subunit ribosomal protein L3